MRFLGCAFCDITACYETAENTYVGLRFLRMLFIFVAMQIATANLKNNGKEIVKDEILPARCRSDKIEIKSASSNVKVGVTSVGEPTCAANTRRASCVSRCFSFMLILSRALSVAYVILVPFIRYTLFAVRDELSCTTSRWMSVRA